MGWWEYSKIVIWLYNSVNILKLLNYTLKMGRFYSMLLHYTHTLLWIEWYQLGDSHLRTLMWLQSDIGTSDSHLKEWLGWISKMDYSCICWLLTSPSKYDLSMGFFQHVCWIPGEEEVEAASQINGSTQNKALLLPYPINQSSHAGCPDSWGLGNRCRSNRNTFQKSARGVRRSVVANFGKEIITFISTVFITVLCKIELLEVWIIKKYVWGSVI